jgi:hypothetical protein
MENADTAFVDKLASITRTGLHSGNGVVCPAIDALNEAPHPILRKSRRNHLA